MTRVSLADLQAKGHKIAIIAIDETKFWRDDIQAKAKRIDCVYLVNLTEPTNLCSPEVSYPAEALRNVVGNFEDYTEDELTELENEGIEADTRYFSEYFNNFTHIKAYDNENEEEVRENEQANPALLFV
jgi:DNA polymerase I-like protein with 3'-5' exonuclease and polymerase domains